MGRLFPSLRMFVFERFAYGYETLYPGIRSGIRSVGIDLIGAAGSMVLFVGIICGAYLFYHTRKVEEKKRIILGWMIITGALLFMGRTGLYLGGIALLFVLIDCVRRREKSIRWILMGNSFIVICLFVFFLVAEDSWEKWAWWRWITEIGNPFSENATITVLLKMDIPPLTTETFWGTGYIRGTTPSGIILNHDSGYIQTYAGIGLIGCLLYYGLIYLFYSSMIFAQKMKMDRKLYFLFLLVIAFAEIKEPFLRKTPLTLILSCMLLMAQGGSWQKRSEKGINTYKQ